jgi:alkyl hydroperoxide reductase subunit F
MELSLKFNLPQETQLKPGEETGQIFDLAIVGGGPAGMTAAVYALRKQLKTLMITGDLGGQILWTNAIENYMGYQYVTGPELSKKFSEQVQQFTLKLAQNELLTGVAEAQPGAFALTTNAQREFRAKSIILATGKRWRELQIPGEKEYRGRGVSYCAICDGPFFKGQKVIVVGGGNSAAEAALDMLELGCQVMMVNLAAGWQADPVLMQRLTGRVQLRDRAKLVSIQGDGQRVTGAEIASAHGGPSELWPAAGVFIEIGLAPNTEMFQGFIALNPQREIITDAAARTSRPGVYAAGDCTSVPEKQIIIAAGDGAKAALSAYRFIKKLDISQAQP